MLDGMGQTCGERAASARMQALVLHAAQMVLFAAKDVASGQRGAGQLFR
jgi:hypothetical protein